MTSVPDLSAKINSLYVGSVENRWPGKPPSAIGKRPTTAALRLGENGFVDDSQADREVHGGPEKALHHYAAEHMDYWRQVFPDHAEKFKPGCFGENISTYGMNEKSLCIGDILTMGSALVQVCQGRQPCWKLNAHMDIPEMAAAFQRTSLTGWYYRVLEAGIVQTGEMIRLIERKHPDWPLIHVIQARFDPKLKSGHAKALSENPAISESWRSAFQKKQIKGYREDTRARLIGLS